MLLRALTLGLALLVAQFGAGTGPASASESARPMTAAEFEAFVEGRTLTFGFGGTVYGIEQYLPNRRVIWRFLGEDCRHGRWFDDGPLICFVYDDEPGQLHCWTFHETPRGLRARFARNGTDDDPVEVRPAESPLVCPGEFFGA